MEIRRGAYGPPQAGKLSNDLLVKRLEVHGYIQAKTTPGLLTHQTQHIRFCLVVDNFGVEYVGEHNARYLINTLKQCYNIEEDWEVKVFLILI